MFVSPEGKSLGSVGRRILGACALISALAVIGAAHQALATAKDRRRYAPPGRMADAGGHKLHLNVMGEDKRGPTIDLETGGQSTSPQWARIQPGIADFARVVSYDRAGLGWSEPGPKPRDARAIARELHAALESAGMPGPYVLVGASLGGPYALVFTGMYPEQAAGVVLVDSVHPDQLERLPAQVVYAIRALTMVNRVMPLLARLGILRPFDVTKVLLAGLPAGLPPEAGAQMRAFSAWPGHWAAVHDEVSVWNETMSQVREAMSARGLGERPLVVLTAPDTPGFEVMRDPWLEMQEELAALSSNSRHRVIEGAGHMSLVTDPEHTREVVGAVREVVEVVRAGA